MNIKKNNNNISEKLKFIYQASLQSNDFFLNGRE
jgi:hypothetical protein